MIFVLLFLACFTWHNAFNVHSYYIRISEMNNILSYSYATVCLPTVNGYFCSFHFLVIMNNAAIGHWCTNIFPSACFQFFGICTHKWNFQSYGNSMFNFLRNHCTLFHRGCIIVHSYWQYAQFSHIFTNTYSINIIFFLIITTIIGMKCYLIMVLIEFSK